MATTTTNYSGRKVDLLIFQNPDYTGKNVQVTLDFGSPSKITTGIQKAVQRWTILFLTRRGSALGDPELGTDFMTKLLKQQLPDDLAIQNEFAIAARDITDYLIATSSSTIPDDELIIGATLLDGWNLSKTMLKLRIGLTSRAGTAYTVVVPVPVVIK
jgi:hypothetical protein